MFFNSLAFAIFLPSVVGLYWLAPPKYRVGLLVIASYVFYSWWDVRFLSLIIISTVTDFIVGRRIHSETSQGTRKAWLLVSLTVNLGVADVDVARTRLEARGVRFSGPTRDLSKTVRMAEFKDPDGNRFRLTGRPAG